MIVGYDHLPDVGGNILISWSVDHSLIDFILRSTFTLELIRLSLSKHKRCPSILTIDHKKVWLCMIREGGRVGRKDRNRDIPPRSLVQLSTLFIWDSRVLSPLGSSDLNRGSGELGSNALIYSRLVCYLSALILFIGRGRGHTRIRLLAGTGLCLVRVDALLSLVNDVIVGHGDRMYSG
jgi:hypothetical protein